MKPLTSDRNFTPTSRALGSFHPSVGTVLLKIVVVVVDVVTPVEVTTKLILLEVPPAGAGVNTVMPAVPAEETSDALITACNDPEFTNVVPLADPFHCTAELGTKLLPVTVKVKPAAPAFALLGEIDEIAGEGLEIPSLPMTCATVLTMVPCEARACSQLKNALKLAG